MLMLGQKNLSLPNRKWRWYYCS